MTPLGPVLRSVVGVAAAAAGLWASRILADGDDGAEAGAAPTVAGQTQTIDRPLDDLTATTLTSTTTTSTTTTTTTTTVPPYQGWVDPTSVGCTVVRAWGRSRGCSPSAATRPARSTAEVRARESLGGLDPRDRVLQLSRGRRDQGLVRFGLDRPALGVPAAGIRRGRHGTWWLAFGGYDRNVTFLDPETGAEVYGPYTTGDIIKGSITVDPDGYPLLYTGSRDNNYHIVAIDRPEPEALWKLNSDAVKPTKWNDDWDGSGLIIDDYLFEGGENSRFFVVKLNRGYDTDGLVTVDPEIVFSTESWDADLLAATSNEMSIENSVAISGDTVYFANSNGLIQGWDIGAITDGEEPERVFRFWAGEDVDASLVIDGDGMIYAGVEYEKGRARAQELGQVLKLDPSEPDDPLVWSVQANVGIKSGVWATPALHRDILIVATDDGRVLGLDRVDGSQRWQLDLPGPLWQSPVVVDDVLIQGDCNGVMHGFDVSDTAVTPTELWSVVLGEGCLESTPAVWDGGIYVGSRNGTFYALRDD